MISWSSASTTALTKLYQIKHAFSKYQIPCFPVVTLLLGLPSYSLGNSMEYCLQVFGNNYRSHSSFDMSWLGDVDAERLLLFLLATDKGVLCFRVCLWGGTCLNVELQRFQPRAIFVCCLQVRPIFLVLTSRSLLQVFFGWPLILLSLGVPPQGLCDDAGGSVSYPAPSFHSNYSFYWDLAGPFLYIDVTDGICPANVENHSETAIWEFLGFSIWGFTYSPGFSTVKQCWLHIGVEQSNLSGRGQLSECPDVLKLDEGNSYFANPCLDFHPADQWLCPGKWKTASSRWVWE